MPSRPRALAILLVLLAALTGCDREPAVYRDRLLVFGTVVELSLHGVSEEQGRKTASALQQQFAEQHVEWHAWRPGGELGELNRHIARGESMPVEPQLRGLLLEAQGLATRTDGRFNPAIGRLIALWGFHTDAPEPREPPAAADIDALLATHPRMTDLVLAGDRVSSTNPGVQLDLGGFAKGAAIDLALERLRQLGIDNAIVNAGGDLGAIGRPGARRWQIGIRAPRGEGVLASMEIDSGERVFTSGDYERFFSSGGERYGHVIDPATGRPAQGAVSATVIHSRGTVADAAATALLVAGPEHWREVARALDLDYVMLIDGAGRAYLTPAMAERIRFETPPAQRIVAAP